jgi:hypothetical protein
VEDFTAVQVVRPARGRAAASRLASQLLLLLWLLQEQVLVLTEGSARDLEPFLLLRFYSSIWWGLLVIEQPFFLAQQGVWVRQWQPANPWWSSASCS